MAYVGPVLPDGVGDGDGLPDGVEAGARVEEVLLRLGQGVVGQVQHLQVHKVKSVK